MSTVRKSWIDVDGAVLGIAAVSRVVEVRGRRLRARLLTAVAVVGSLSVATVAYGYWVSSGGGVGTGLTLSSSAISITAGAPTNALYPGIASDVALALNNNGTVQLHVSSLSLDTGQGVGGFTVDGAHSSCSPAVALLSFQAPPPPAGGWTLGPKSTTAITLGSAISMGAAAPSVCQGASFSVFLKAA